MNLDTTVQATELPITLDKAKSFLRIVENHEDALIESLISAAVERFKQLTGRSGMTETLTAHFDMFPRVINLERSPVQSVTSVEYLDSDGNWNLLAASEYSVDIHDDSATIQPPYQSTWPCCPIHRENSVRVVYVVGYTEFPIVAKQWLKLAVADMYENRNPDVPYNLNRLKFVDHLLDSLIIPREFVS